MLYIQSVISLAFLLIGPAQNRPFVEEVLQGHEPIADAALYVTKHYISMKTTTLIIMEQCYYCSRLQKNYHARLLQHYLKQFDVMITLRLFAGESNERPWDYNIFVVDSVLAFNELRLNFPDTLHEREFYFIIILTLFVPDDETRYAVMKEILQICFNFNVQNVVVLHTYANGSVGFFTYHLFEPDDCQRIIHVDEFNHYSDGVLKHDLLFPPQLYNFQNCPLNVSAYVLYPMLNFIGDTQNPKDLSELWRLSGIEGDIMKMLAESMNFRINLHIPQEVSFLGSNGNVTGCFAELQNGTADVAVGGFTKLHSEALIFSTSLSYYQTPVVFVIRSSLHFGPLQQLFHPFNAPVWFAIGLVLLIGIVIIKLICYYDKRSLRDFIIGQHNQYPIYNLIIVLIGGDIAILPQRNFARFLLMSWMLTSLIIRNAYQGKMFDSLRMSRRVPLPRSIAELIEFGYILMTKDYNHFYPRNLTIFVPSMSERYEIIQTHNERLTSMSLLDTLSYYNRFNWNTSRLTYVDEEVYMYQSAIFFRKHSIFRVPFDRKLKLIIAGGVASYIAKHHVKGYFGSVNSVTQKVPRISNLSLLGLYIIYGVLMIISIVVFILEMVSRHSRIIQRLLNGIQ